MKIGYARVSTSEQNLDLQHAALEEAGCEAIFSDRASGASVYGREGLSFAIAHCNPGDILVVWKLDRLGRSMFELIEIIKELNERGAGLQVLTGQGAAIDTSRPEGRMVFGIFASLAEFERELIRERTRAGMAAARQRGSAIGRPRKLDDEQVAKAYHWITGNVMSMSEAASVLGVTLTTLRNSIQKWKEDTGRRNGTAS